MPRPKNTRHISSLPYVTYFKPAGVPLCDLEEIILTIDELEAMKLADIQSLYQQDAAEKMGISRQTFGRIIQSAHKKVAEALSNGKAIKIEGGVFKHISEQTNAYDSQYSTIHTNKIKKGGRRRRRLNYFKD